MIDVENMVNKNSDLRNCARERAAAKKLERRLKKMLMTIYAFLIAASATVLLCCIGATHIWLTCAVVMVCVMAVCFVSGMYVEAVIRK